MEHLLRGLNAAQRAAVTSPASVVQVLAPPGSGKTKTLTSRVAYLLEHYGYAPWNIICCTFTIKASREMRERLRGLVGEREAKLQLGTFHSICRRYLVRYGHLINIPQNFGIADASDSLFIIKRAVKRLNLTIDPKVARSKISLKKSKGFRLGDVVKTPAKTADAQEFHRVFTEYETDLKTSNLLDYDDLLIRCSDLLRAHPECVSNIQALLIDEFQDTNVIQFELMKLLASAHRRITIVGDPDQSIYGFRSAEVENLHRMRVAYPDTVVINLEENYRSGAAILKVAQEVIEQNTDRPEKKMKATHGYGTLPVFRHLPNAYEEARWIATEVKRTVTMTAGLIQYSDVAILLRSAFLSLKIEKELARAGIPYRMVGGHKFFERVEVRTLLDYLRAISQPDNNPALVSILNVPSRRIGEVSIKEWLRVSDETKIPLWTALQKMLAGELRSNKPMSAAVAKSVRELVEFIKAARTKMITMQPYMVPLDLLTLIINQLKYKEYLKTKYSENHEDRWENVQELLQQATDFAAGEAAIRNPAEELPIIEGVAQREVPPGEEMLAQYLSNIVLSTEIETSDEEQEKPRVTISTIHSAKGLEWPVVFVPAAYEGSIPHSRAEDTCEERRLLYVAMTRAQALLNITFPRMGQEYCEQIITQFLPPKIESQFAQFAPDFCDSTIEGMATTIRREVPKQADLVEIRLSLTGLESPSDDLWPVDGSERPFQFRDPGAAIYEHQNGSDSYQSRTLRESLSPSRNRPSGTRGFASASTIQMSNTKTTMDELRGFSWSSATFKFDDIANSHLSSDMSQAHGSTKVDGSRQKGLQGKRDAQSRKTDQGRASLASFFTQSRSTPSFDIARVEPTLPGTKTALKMPDPIPEEFSSHTLTTRALPAKRPRVKSDGTPSPSRKKPYGFLSSSPGQENLYPAKQQPDHGSVIDPIYLSEEDTTAATASAKASNAVTSSTSRSGPDVQQKNIKSESACRPATTMHTTSMSTLSSKPPARKTLGIRRTMNGWENRRNK